MRHCGAAHPHSHAFWLLRLNILTLPNPGLLCPSSTLDLFQLLPSSFSLAFVPALPHHLTPVCSPPRSVGFFSSLLMSFRLFLLYTAKTRVLLALRFLDCSILIHVCGSRAANPDSRASPKQQARLGLAGGRNPRATCAALLDWRGRLRGEASNVEQLVGGRVKPQFFVGCSQPRS